jgi:hypothetical protein
LAEGRGASIGIEGTADEIMSLVAEALRAVSRNKTAEQEAAVIRYACRLNAALRMNGETYQ